MREDRGQLPVVREDRGQTTRQLAASTLLQQRSAIRNEGG